MTDVAQQDVVALLLEQHNQIKTLFNQVSTARGTQKRELFEDLVRLLAVHESAEEEVVHPAGRPAEPDGRRAQGRGGHRPDPPAPRCR